jgi:hypothetical protein
MPSVTKLFPDTVLPSQLHILLSYCFLPHVCKMCLQTKCLHLVRKLRRGKGKGYISRIYHIIFKKLDKFNLYFIDQNCVMRSVRQARTSWDCDKCHVTNWWRNGHVMLLNLHSVFKILRTAYREKGWEKINLSLINFTPKIMSIYIAVHSSDQKGNFQNHKYLLELVLL